MALKLTTEEIKKRFSELYNGEYELVSNYENNASEAIIRHKKCGNEFKVSRLTRFFNLSNNCPCPKCRPHGTGKRLTFETYKERVKEKYGNQYEILSFTKMHDKVKIKCNNCGNIFEAIANTLFLNKRFSGCPNCRESLRGKHANDKEYLQHALEAREDGNEYTWLEEYKGNPKLPHKIKHKCGYEYEVKPIYFRYGDKVRCPNCNRKRSKTEISFINELKKLYPNIKENERSVINPYELDAYIEDKKIAFEYNGLYWHSEKRKGRYYHRDKMLKCNEKGIRLVQIFEDEWEQHREIVISKIKSILGVQNTNRIYARKCECREIDAKLYRPFLIKNHIQGECPITTAFGLFYENELVAVGGFNKLRNSMNSKNIDNAYDMVRYATDINKNIIGGCGKIISTFVKEKNCKYMKTLADLRWSSPTKNMYLSLGFSKANEVPPRYFYTNGHKRFPRFEYRKANIKIKFPKIYDEKLTEFQMMDKTSLWRIWDAGKITYEKFF